MYLIYFPTFPFLPINAFFYAEGKCLHRLSKSYCWPGKAGQVMDARDFQNLSLSFPLSSKGYQYTEVFGRVMLQCAWLKTSPQSRGWMRHLKLALVLDYCTPHPKVIHFVTRGGQDALHWDDCSSSSWGGTCSVGPSPISSSISLLWVHNTDQKVTMSHVILSRVAQDKSDCRSSVSVPWLWCNLQSRLWVTITAWKDVLLV